MYVLKIYDKDSIEVNEQKELSINFEKSIQEKSHLFH